MTDQPPVGAPLLDAVTVAIQAAYDEGAEAAHYGGQATKAAHDRTVAALSEVQRLWRQLEIELTAARQPKATAPAGR